MNVRVLAALVLCGSALGCAASLASQHATPQAAAAVGEDARATAANLRVLPKDLSRADLDSLMHQYGEDLGVSCGYCHAKDPRTGKLDYASEGNPRKQTARIMIAMLRDINGKYLAQLGDPDYPVIVTCGNCHQGRTNPPDFQSSAAAVSQR